MKMEDELLDLRALDPAADPGRLETLAERIVAAALPELQRRAGARSPLAVIARWARPTLSTAASLAFISACGLALVRGRDSTGASEGAPSVGAAEGLRAGLVQALSLPRPVSVWLAEDRAPDTSDLILALEEMP
jgi:hypothetical protein